MLDWDKLRIFHAVAEAGSLTHAGDTLNLSQSSISRQISTLESSLNTPLFQRHARGLTLTEQGEVLFATVSEMATRLAAAETKVSDSHEKPSGILRVSTPVGFGSIWLTERLTEFIDLYPDIELQLTVNNRELDLTVREADVAIRMRPPRQVGHVYRRLVTMRHMAFAAPDYLKRFGTPQTLLDLDQHRLLGFDEAASSLMTDVNWLMHAETADGSERHPILRINNIYGLFRACVAGMGIASLPDYMANLARDLVPILQDYKGPKFSAFLVYPEELRNSSRLQVFRDFLLQKIREDMQQGGGPKNLLTMG